MVACSSAHSAKLVGTYEKELHSIVDQLQNEPFEQIIDIGAAEGYYAVGFARAHPNTCRVIAFEALEHGRSLMRNLAAYNQATTLEIRGTCDVAALRELLSEQRKTLIICDVEGFEAALLDPHFVPGLLQCSILVEIHDTPDTPISTIIRQRFRSSHTVEEIASVSRTWQDFPARNLFARVLPRALCLRAMNEARGSQSWFWMRPLARSDKQSHQQ